MANTRLLIEQISIKINEAVESSSEVNLSADEVKILAKELNEKYFLPVFTNEQIVQMIKSRKVK
ncbi:MAG: hypothetical protein H9855_03940 [Candidatus Acinetobacter avistercoris]|nr:hypothetical protein [Candidatus Acinetobacter avistercoris]